MKSMISALFLIFVLSLQAKTQTILTKEYYFVNGREITQLKQVNDTLYEYKCRLDFNCLKDFSDHYKILQTKSDSINYLIKVEKLDTLQLSSTPIPPKRFRLIGIKKLDQEKIRYSNFTLSLTQDSISVIPFDLAQMNNVFGFTAYTKDYLNSLNKDYSFSKAEAEEILNAMKSNKKLIQLYKKSVISKTDLYGSGITSELLNREMIKQNLNPIYARQEIEKALKN